MKLKIQYLQLLILAGLLCMAFSCQKESAYTALIITGQGNENWQESSVILKKLLDQTNLFSAQITRTPRAGGDMASFNPDFNNYNVVVLDYNGDPWSDETRRSFVEYVSNGGGVVIYRESNQAFPEWKEYNEITGLGGGGNRSEKDGPYVFHRSLTNMFIDYDFELMVDSTPGPAGAITDKHMFEVRAKKLDHPVIKGLPLRWLHGNDVLYSRLRGPARNMEILAAAYSDPEQGGSDRHEPVLFTVRYGKGRIFHTVLGIAEEGGGSAMECAGFIATFQRGAEWAASGLVTQAIPFDFPTAAFVSLRSGFKELTLKEDIAKIANYKIPYSNKYYNDILARVRDAGGDPEKLLRIEKAMVSILENKNATTESKKLMLRELSWMGSDYCIPYIQKLVGNEELNDEVEFALKRLNP